jgi:hypothetical protein
MHCDVYADSSPPSSLPVHLPSDKSGSGAGFVEASAQVHTGSGADRRRVRHGRKPNGEFDWIPDANNLPASIPPAAQFPFGLFPEPANGHPPEMQRFISAARESANSNADALAASRGIALPSDPNAAAASAAAADPNLQTLSQPMGRTAANGNGKGNGFRFAPIPANGGGAAGAPTAFELPSPAEPPSPDLSFDTFVRNIGLARRGVRLDREAPADLRNAYAPPAFPGAGAGGGAQMPMSGGPMPTPP